MDVSKLPKDVAVSAWELNQWVKGLGSKRHGLKALGIYGSTSRGTVGKGSDLDVLVVGKDEAGAEELSEQLRTLAEEKDLPIQVEHFTHRQALANLRDRKVIGNFLPRAVISIIPIIGESTLQDYRARLIAQPEIFREHGSYALARVAIRNLNKLRPPNRKIQLLDLDRFQIRDPRAVLAEVAKSKDARRHVLTLANRELGLPKEHVEYAMSARKQWHKM